jgi:hypothetical protein
LHADSLINNAHLSKIDGSARAIRSVCLAEAVGLTRFNFTFLDGWFDMRDLGAALDHEESLAPSGMHRPRRL